jgi:hypothetical protein
MYAVGDENRVRANAGLLSNAAADVTFRAVAAQSSFQHPTVVGEVGS